MPDHDWALGQNEVDVRNEARRPANGWEFVKWADEVDNDLTEAIKHLAVLHQTVAINEDAEQRRQESITRTLDEIQRLMDG